MTDVNTQDLQVFQDGGVWKSDFFVAPTGDITTFEVKNPVQDYPIQVMIPFKKGFIFDETSLQIRNSSGDPIPAQFTVQSKWWGIDGSLKHVQAHFLCDGSDYTLAIGPNPAPPVPVETGHYNIGEEYTVSSEFLQEDGVTTEYQFDRTDKVEVVEEAGPIRWVGKVYAPTIFNDEDDVTPGFVMRTYRWAGSPLVKIDFSLQNCAFKNNLGAAQQFSSVLYFQGHKLVLSDGSGSGQLRADTAPVSNVGALGYGSMDTSTIRTCMRNFYEMFPNGLEADATGVHVELFPEWSSQFVIGSGGRFTTDGMYWLDDLSCPMQEILFDTSKTVDPATFQIPPLAVLPFAYHQEMRASSDLFGVLPPAGVSPANSDPAYLTDSSYVNYQSRYEIGKWAYGLDTDRYWNTAGTGGVPYRNQRFLMTGSPGDYIDIERFGMAEVTMRPQRFPLYNYDNDRVAIRPTQAPYAGASWRHYTTSPPAGVDYQEKLYRGYEAYPDAERMAWPRDSQHQWWYHAQDAWIVTGNLWIKDWYEEMNEFLKSFLNMTDAFPSNSMRGQGHMFSQAAFCYDITGDPDIMDAARWYLTSGNGITVGGMYGIIVGNAASFQIGYFTRGIMNMQYLQPRDEWWIELVGRYITWNRDIGNWTYYNPTETTIKYEPSETNGGTLVANTALWTPITGDPSYAQNAEDYVNGDLGDAPYLPSGGWTNWNGKDWQNAGYIWWLNNKTTNEVFF